MYGQKKFLRFQKKKKLFFPKSWKSFSLLFFCGKQCLTSFYRLLWPKYWKSDFFTPFGPFWRARVQLHARGPSEVRYLDFPYFDHKKRHNRPRHFLQQKNDKEKPFQLFGKKSCFFLKPEIFYLAIHFNFLALKPELRWKRNIDFWLFRELAHVLLL